jgi:RNA polymerase sigma-70 factor (ECF subfamily)
VRIGEEQLRALMLAGLDGDGAAHAALLDLAASLLRSFYRRRARADADDIEDLVQETLIAVHDRRASYDRDRPFAPWLFAIARYKMIDHFRRRSRLQPIDEFDGMLAVEGFEDASLARTDLARLLDRLPAKQAQAIRATRIEGLSVAEAAARAGIGESDVKVSVHRGLKALAARVKGWNR